MPEHTVNTTQPFLELFFSILWDYFWTCPTAGWQKQYRCDKGTHPLEIKVGGREEEQGNLSSKILPLIPPSCTVNFQGNLHCYWRHLWYSSLQNHHCGLKHINHRWVPQLRHVPLGDRQETEEDHWALGCTVPESLPVLKIRAEVYLWCLNWSPRELRGEWHGGCWGKQAGQRSETSSGVIRNLIRNTEPPLSSIDKRGIKTTAVNRLSTHEWMGTKRLH